MADITVRDHPEESRYEISVDGEIGGVLSYRREPGAPVDLEHTVVLPTHRGQGLAGKLVEGAFDDLRAKGEQAVVSCGYILGWLPDHPEVEDLVAGRKPPVE